MVISGGGGGKNRRKSTRGPHTLSPPPPRRICGHCRNGGARRGHAHPIGPRRAVGRRAAGRGEIDIRTATPLTPRVSGRWAGLDGTAASATHGPPSRPAHWPPPRFSLATLTRLTGRTRRAHIAHARRTSHRAHDDRRRHCNRADTYLHTAYHIPSPRPSSVDRDHALVFGTSVPPRNEQQQQQR